jgi:cytochrome c oxidase subunit II
MSPRIQSALDAAGIQAARIEGLWWILFWICSAVYVAVLTALVVALIRSRRRTDAPPSERQLTTSVASATGLTIVILIGLVFASVVTGRALGFNRELPDRADAPDALVVHVTGKQWWWTVEYDNPTPSLRVTTANELHLPVGRRVVITLKAADVIHSFWVPNLHGKVDLVPGRRNIITLQADKPGFYRGQCAEYCGLQHAHMAFTIVAESPDAFEQWLAAQRAPAPAPTTPEQKRGLEVLQTGPCAMCHAVQGTTAGARFGPDLTHVATRSTIAAGTIPNTRDNLRRWIVDPQHIKPGSRMPAVGLSSEDIEALLAYLETLK